MEPEPSNANFTADKRLAAVTAVSLLLALGSTLEAPAKFRSENPWKLHWRGQKALHLMMWGSLGWR